MRTNFNNCNSHWDVKHFSPDEFQAITVTLENFSCRIKRTGTVCAELPNGYFMNFQKTSKGFIIKNSHESRTGNLSRWPIGGTFEDVFSMMAWFCGYCIKKCI